jgi:hypothetical protein
MGLGLKMRGLRTLRNFGSISTIKRTSKTMIRTVLTGRLILQSPNNGFRNTGETTNQERCQMKMKEEKLIFQQAAAEPI